ncbi:MAG: metallophosphoesterase family protein [Saprospiraceae bacterium]
MTRIGLMSDTHSFLDDKVYKYFERCDEVWHAGDIGSIELADKMEAFKPFRAVYGNIDNAKLRQRYPLDLRFECDGLDVWMTHIGGYPKRYSKRVREQMPLNPPRLFISGHSHILKVMPDNQFGLLHINPGACGNHGFHQMKTLVRFSIDAGEIMDLEVVELGKRGKISE